uniref:EF-hand domain-containing protein n=1 Tax=Alexandrium andersonii TaxID=327968 RepID=A0A7S2AYZ0_9DINO|mmetsp:Transcript_20073/g.45603  ORF Transcript_20073/g.45603 Transcript_20073/m.45603 type:complete len:221 (+) Transcript_20073:93-755(+)
MLNALFVISAVVSVAGGSPTRPRHPTAVRHHLAALAQDRRVRAEDARLRREAATLRKVAERADFAGSRTSGHRSAVLAAGGVGALVLGGGLLIALKAYDILRLHPQDENGDGKVDWADVKQFFRRHVCCGLNAKALRSLCQLLAFAVAGFAFLWWKHMLQPILQSLLVYSYIAVVVLLIFGIVAAEVTGDVAGSLSTAHSAVKNVERVFNQGTKDIDDHL